jgi:hypothetical protein
MGLLTCVAVFFGSLIAADMVGMACAGGYDGAGTEVEAQPVAVADTEKKEVEDEK